MVPALAVLQLTTSRRVSSQPGIPGAGRAGSSPEPSSSESGGLGIWHRLMIYPDQKAEHRSHPSTCSSSAASPKPVPPAPPACAASEATHGDRLGTSELVPAFRAAGPDLLDGELHLGDLGS
jgi:hypothetical protein